MLSLVFTSRVCGEFLSPIDRAVNQLRPDCAALGLDVRLRVVFAGLDIGDFVDVTVKRIARDAVLNALRLADIAVSGADVLDAGFADCADISACPALKRLRRPSGSSYKQR